MRARPVERFPYMAHRTMADVLRTEELTAKANAGREKFTSAESGEFGRLMQRFYRHNPPTEPQRAA